MKFESFPQPKPAEELQNQVDKTDQNIDTNLVNESIKKDLELLPVSELKEKYKVRYDAYLALLRADKQGKSLEEKDLKKAQVYITAFNNLDNYIQEQERGERKVLRGRQIHVFDAIRDKLEEGITRGYVKLPTGVGKTVLFSQVLEALKMKAFIGVPSLPLVRQTSDKLETFTDRTYGVYTGEEKDLTKEITTITYQSLISAVRNNVINPKDIPVFIADESHKSKGPETSKAMEDFDLVLEFTATPGHDLPEKIYEMKLKEAIKEGLVCQTKTIHAYTDLDLSTVPIVAGDYEQKELEKLVNNHGRNMAALELYKDKFSHLQAMVNCTGVQHAKDVAELFQKNGVKAVAVYGDMPEDEKNKILGYIDKDGVRHPSMIETGEVQVITQAQILVEGFDEQSISVALNLAPTMSPTRAEQRGGRALRLDDNNPEKWAYVIDFIDQNKTKKPVLFSQILEGDIVTPDESEDRGNRDFDENYAPRESTPPIDLSHINIDGLRVVVDTHEIMKVTKEHELSQEKKEIKVWEYETLRADVISQETKSSSDYVNKASENGWPSINTLVKMPEFPKHPDGTNDWDTFLNTGKEYKERKVWTYKTLRADVISQETKSSGDYESKQKENGWPGINTLIKMPEFPKHPDGTNDWDTFLNTGKEYKERKVWTYKTLRADVISQETKSSSDYVNKASENGWPSKKKLIKMPEFPKHSDGSNDWDTFFGREKFDFEKFRQDVISQETNSSNDYIKKAQENSWPALATLTKMPEFPKKPDGSNDWDTFLGKNEK